MQHCPESDKVGECPRFPVLRADTQIGILFSVSPACSKTRASFEVCNEFAATEIDTSSQAQRSKHTKMVIKIKGAINVVKKKDTNKVKVVKSQSISTRTTPAKLVNAA
jgi:hypothetical protein